MITIWGFRPDWGNVPTWIAAVMASLAAGFTSLAFRRDRKSLVRLEEEAAGRHRAEMRKQAAQVTLTPTGEGHPDPQRGPYNFAYATITVRNGSSEPIYQARLQIVAPQRSNTFGLRPVVAGGAAIETQLPEQIVDGVDIHTYCVDFVDSSGKAWRRYADGPLVARVFREIEGMVDDESV